MANVNTYKPTEGRTRLKTSYHVASEARRASRLAPIGFDDVPPADFVSEPLPKVKSRNKTRKTRKAGTKKRTFMKAKPRKTRKAKPRATKRFVAETWKDKPTRFVVIDNGENSMICEATYREVADSIADAMNAAWDARKAVA